MQATDRNPSGNMTAPNSTKPGPDLIGDTGSMGYQVLPAVQQDSAKMWGHYVTDNHPRTCVWLHKKSYKVLMNIEDLVCIATGENAVPEDDREKPESSREPIGKVGHRTHQFQVVVWTSELSEEDAVDFDDEDSVEDPEEGLWRMGYVMNNMGETLRVMVPSGRLYILYVSRVVIFVPRDHWNEMVVGDKEIPALHDISYYRDDDWKFDEDVLYKETTPSALSVKFVKDKAYPRQTR